MNLLGISAHLMSPEKGDQATLCNSRLIASMAAFRGRRSSRKIKS